MTAQVAAAGSSTTRKILRALRSKRDLARLNHIFIPEKKADRDRFRRSIVGRSIGLFFGAYLSLSREGRALFMVTLLIGFAGLDVLQTQVHLLFAMLSGLILASLAMRPLFRAKGLTVAAEAPARVSVGEVQRFVVTLSNRSDAPLLSLRIVAPFLPWDGTWVTPPSSVARVPPKGSATSTAEARFLARGEHHIDAFEAAMLAPLGLAIGPRRASNGPKFLVIPRIAPVARLSLRHTLPSARDARVLTQKQGEAEFASVRPYRSGDPLKHLHARTWARTGTPHVRAYVAEHSERVGLALALDDDIATETEKEAALSLAAGIVAHLTKAGTTLASIAIDTSTFDIGPRRGRAAQEAALDRLSVHALTKKVEPVEEAIEEGMPTLSSLVLVSADASERRAALVARLSSRGFPVRWIVVSADPAEGGENPTRVSVATVDGEAGISL